MKFKNKKKTILSVGLLLALISSGTVMAQDVNERENQSKRSLDDIITVDSMFMDKTLNASSRFDTRYYKYFNEKESYENSDWAIAFSRLLELGDRYGTEYSALHIDLATAQDGPYESFKDTAHYRNARTGGNSQVGLGYLTSGKGPVTDDDNIETKTNLKAEGKLEEYRKFLPIYKWREKISSYSDAKYHLTVTDTFQSGDSFNGIKTTTETAIYREDYAGIYMNTAWDNNSLVYTAGEVEQNRNDIKEHIIKYGAVSAKMYIDSKYFVSTYLDKIIHEERSYTSGSEVSRTSSNDNKVYATVPGGLSYYCTQKDAIPNRDVVIIGWDDNYTASYTGATGKGAYLVLDSNDKNRSSYWVSYDDYYIESNVYGIGKIGYVDYDNIYQVDPLGMSTSITGVMKQAGYSGQSYSNEVYGANVFLRKDKDMPERLNEVSVAIEIPEKVEVYVNPRVNNSKDIKEQLKEENLIKVVNLTDTLQPGYHTLKLDKDIYLTDESFAVVVKYVADSKDSNYNNQFAKIGVQSPVKVYYKAQDNKGQVNTQVEKVYEEVPYWQNAGKFAKQGQCFTGYTLDEWVDLTEVSETANMTISVKAFTTIDETYEQLAEKIIFPAEEININKGDTEYIEATIKPDNIKNKKLYWTSEDSRIARVDQEGNVTGVSAGSVMITATARGVEDDSVFAKIKVNVTVPLEYMTLNQASVTMVANESYFLAPVLSPEDATIKEIKWSSSNSKICRVTDEGFLIGLEQGKAKITATVTDMDGNVLSATCDVSVPEGLIVGVTEIKMKEATKTLETGEKYNLEATVYPENATNKEVIWTSDNSSIVSVNKSTGRITALAPGEATITATTVNNGVQDTCKITVTQKQNKAVTNVSINPKTTTLQKNNSKKLTATIEPENATNKKLTWTSDNKDCVIVGNDGTITGVNPGTANITVTTEDGQKTDTCTVTVDDTYINVLSVDVSPTAKTIDFSKENERTFNLKVTIQPLDATNKEVTYESSDTNVATVDENGKVTVVGVGEAIIRVSSILYTENKADATCVVKSYDSIDISDFDVTYYDGTSLTAVDQPWSFKEGLSVPLNWLRIKCSELGEEAEFLGSEAEWSSNNENLIKLKDGCLYAVPQTTLPENPDENYYRVTLTASIVKNGDTSNSISKNIYVQFVPSSEDNISCYLNDYRVVRIGENYYVCVPPKTLATEVLSSVKLIRPTWGYKTHINHNGNYAGTGAILRIYKDEQLDENGKVKEGEVPVVKLFCIVKGDSLVGRVNDEREWIRNYELWKWNSRGIRPRCCDCGYVRRRGGLQHAGDI